MDYTDRTKPMTASEERDLLQTVGKEKARERIILSNVPFVLQKAKEMSRQYIEDLEDIFQEGMIGLSDAYEKYDPTLGTRFLTYAVARADRYMRNFIRSNQTPLYEPNNFYVDLNFVNAHGMPEKGDIVGHSKWNSERQRCVENRVMFNVSVHEEEDKSGDTLSETTDRGLVLYEDSLEVSHNDNENLSIITQYADQYHQVLCELYQKNPLSISIFNGYVEGFKRYEVLAREYGITKQRIGQIIGEVSRKVEKRLRIAGDAVTFGRALFEYNLSRI